MPRNAFVADLQYAIDGFRSENVSDLKAGDEDGVVSFEYITHDGGSEGKTRIQAIIDGTTAIPVQLYQVEVLQRLI